MTSFSRVHRHGVGVCHSSIVALVFGVILALVGSVTSAPLPDAINPTQTSANTQTTNEG